MWNFGCWLLFTVIILEFNVNAGQGHMTVFNVEDASWCDS